MTTTTTLLRSALAVLVLAGSGCASNDASFAERVEDIAEDWRDGKKDVTRGRDLVEDGRDDVKKAQRKVDRRREELLEAERGAGAAKQAYDAALVLSDAGTTAEALEDDNSPLAKLKSRTEKAEDTVKDARKNVDRAQNDVRDGQKKIRRGEELMRKGQRKMIEAEAAYRMEPGADPNFFDRMFD